MRYWVFHEEMLSSSLAEFEARRIKEGATPAQARAEVEAIARFMTSDEAKKLVGGAA